jgi:hypothetical protein
MIKPQGQIDHESDFGDDLGAAAKAGDEVTNIAVVLLDGEGQVFAGEELVFGDEAMETLLIVGQERMAFEADFIEKLLTGGIITPTQKPGQSLPLDRIKRSPKPFAGADMGWSEG